MDNPTGLDRQAADDLGDFLGVHLRNETPNNGKALPQTGSSQPLRSPAPSRTSSFAPAPAQRPSALADLSNPFLRFFALGYTALVPLIPVGASISETSSLALRIGRAGAKDPRGKAPGVLTPAGWIGHHAWTRGASATTDDCDRWHAMGADVGLRMGDGLFGLDVDTLDAGLAATCWWTLCRIIPGAHAKRIGRSPKFAVLLRVPLDVRLPYKLIEFGKGPDGKPERVEGLSNGKQLKVHGLHPTTGLPYTCEPEMPARQDLVEATQAQIDELFEALHAALPASTEVRTEGVGADRSIASLRGDPDMIEAAARRLPNTTKHFPTRESYRDVGYAIKAGIADERWAFEVFAEWSDRWADDPEGEGNVYGYAEAIWRTLHPRKIGASWLLEKLEAVTGEPVAAHWFKPLPATAASVWDAAPAADSAGDGRKPFQLVDFFDVASLALAQVGEPLVEGLLDCGSFVVLYGPSNVGKTFVALDIALHVAMGIAWNGKRIRRMRVVYIAAEGNAGARKRSEALRRRHGLNEAEMRGWFLYRTAPVDLLRPNADLGPAIEAIAAVPDVGLVVIDTMSRALAGGDENSPVDMGGYVRNLDRLRAATSACVLNVHHTGKDVARGARGHSLLRAATDTEIEIAPGEFVVTKQREIETELRLGFVLDVVALGADANGRMVTSCVVRWDPPSVINDLTEKEALVLAALQAVAAQNPAGNARAENITEHLAGLEITMKPDAARQHLKNLVKKQHAVAPGKGRWAPKTGNSSSALGRASENPAVFFPRLTGEELEHDIFA